MTAEQWRQREKYEKSTLNNLPLGLRKAFHPIMKTLLRAQRVICGRRVIVLAPDKTKTDRPVIYAVTHIGKFDVEICAEVINRHFFLLSGDFENLHGNLSGTFLELHGLVYVDKFSREDRAKAKDRAISVLKSGGNMMWFPEGIWNLSESLPVLPCVYGVIEAAAKADAVIVPVGIEQYGKTFYVNFGSALLPERLLNGELESTAAKKEAVALLRDAMASLKWEIWETAPHESRKSVPAGCHEAFIRDKLSEWSGFTYESIKAKEFSPPGNVTSAEVFGTVDSIPLNSKTAFWARHSGSLYDQSVR